VYRYAISVGNDAKKDQSYMLWRIPEYILSKLILPLGDDEKSVVKLSSADAGISAASRDESQEICFVPDGDYAAFIEERTGEISPHGKFIDECGNTLGEHKGIIRYTLGQRRGLGVSAKSRIFVTNISVEDNTITLSPTDLQRDSFNVSGIVFSGAYSPSAEEVYVKVRYAAPRVKAKVTVNCTDKTVSVLLSSPIRAITPGQSAVFYDADGTVLFGGFID
jgi:tRNA-specific 2-thiouridylase